MVCCKVNIICTVYKIHIKFFQRIKKSLQKWLYRNTYINTLKVLTFGGKAKIYTLSALPNDDCQAPIVSCFHTIRHVSLFVSITTCLRVYIFPLFSIANVNINCKKERNLEIGVLNKKLIIFKLPDYKIGLSRITRPARSACLYTGRQPKH